MKRITITLTEELVSVLEHEAASRGTSVSEVVRVFLLKSMIGDGKRALPFAAIYEDASMVTGAEVDNELDAVWADDLDRDRR